jgi:hypothetical protein
MKVFDFRMKTDDDDDTHTYRISSGGVNLLFLDPETISGGYPTDRKTCVYEMECHERK